MLVPVTKDPFIMPDISVLLAQRDKMDLKIVFVSFGLSLNLAGCAPVEHAIMVQLRNISCYTSVQWRQLFRSRSSKTLSHFWETALSKIICTEQKLRPEYFVGFKYFIWDNYRERYIYNALQRQQRSQWRREQGRKLCSVATTLG
jgi:hypothetical protein